MLGDKELAKLPIRVQRFRLRMMAYDYSILYTPGEKLVLTYALSRAPLTSEGSEPHENLFVQEIVDALPISKSRLARLQASIVSDNEASGMMKYINKGWPIYHKV